MKGRSSARHSPGEEGARRRRAGTAVRDRALFREPLLAHAIEAATTAVFDLQMPRLTTQYSFVRVGPGSPEQMFSFSTTLLAAVTRMGCRRRNIFMPGALVGNRIDPDRSQSRPRVLAAASLVGTRGGLKPCGRPAPVSPAAGGRWLSRDEDRGTLSGSPARFALPAGAVTRIAPMPRLSPLPRAAVAVPGRHQLGGVASIPRASIWRAPLGLARSDRAGTGEAVVVRLAGYLRARALTEDIWVSTTQRRLTVAVHAIVDLGESLPACLCHGAASAPIDRRWRRPRRRKPAWRGGSGPSRRHSPSRSALGPTISLDHVIRLADDLRSQRRTPIPYCNQHGVPQRRLFSGDI
jgi:hypothetical protein